MVAVGFLSAKGSPGCTTTVVALSEAWASASPGRRVLLAECDPAGGDVASGYLRGNLDSSRGLLALSVSRPTDALPAVWDQLLALDEAGSRLLLPGVHDPRHGTALRSVWPTLMHAIPECRRQDPPIDVLVDFGRIAYEHPVRELWGCLDLLVLVSSSTLTAVAAAKVLAEVLVADHAERRVNRIGCLLVGEGRPYRSDEVSRELGVPFLGVLPHDPAGARALSGSATPTWRAGRSALSRAARRLAADLMIEPEAPVERFVAGLADV